MTDKERDANEMVEKILRELREQQTRTEISPEPDQPAPTPKAKPAQQPAAAQPPAEPAQPTAAAPQNKQPAEKPEHPAKEVTKQDQRQVEQLYPDVRLPERPQRPLAEEDLIDDQFRQFFTTTVAVDHSEMKRRQNQEQEKKKGFFSRFFSRTQDDDDDEDYDAYEDDAYAEDADDDDAPAVPEKPAPQKDELPKDLFAEEKAADSRIEQIEQPDRHRMTPQAAPAQFPGVKPEAGGVAGQVTAPVKPAPPPTRPEIAPAPIKAAPPPEIAPAPIKAAPPPEIAPAPVTPAPAQPEPIPPTARPEVPTGPLPTAAAVAAMAHMATDLSGIETLLQGDEPEQSAPPPEAAEAEAAGAGQDAGGEEPGMQDLPEEQADATAPKHRGGMFRFVKSREEENPDDEQEETREGAPEEELSAEDYDTPEDADDVEESLKSLKSSLSLRFALTGLVAVFLLYINLAKLYTALPMLSIMDPAKQPVAYLLLCAVLTGICIGVNWPTVSGGIASVAGDPNPDIAPAFAAVFAELQCLLLLTAPDRFAAGSYTPFCGLAVLALAVNALGKAMTCRIVQDNFSMASAGFDHAAAYCIPDENLTKKVTAGLGEKEPQLLVSRPTALVKGFLRQSFSEHPTDRLAKRFGLIAAGASLVCGIAVMVLTHDLLAAASCAACAMCLCTPLEGTLVGAVPAGLMQSAAARVGAVIPGPSAVEQLRSTNVVLLNAKDLFPSGTVALRGIRTFQKERIDLAILYAASILIEGCDTMRDIFLDVVGGKREMLYKVENMTCETGRGFVGWIDGNRIIVGNRDVMTAHDIELPSMDYERKYTGADKHPVYLAVSGRLFGMFLVSYRPSPEVQETVDDLRRSGMSLLVRSNDFCLTGELIANCYGISPDSVKVLNEAGEQALRPHLEYLPSAEGVMTHIGSFASFAGGLHAALAACAAERLAGMVEAASVILALIITLMLTFGAGLAHLSVLAVLLYQLAWLILTLALPLVKKY